MNDHLDPWDDPVVHEDLSGVLSVDFVAFFSQYHGPYLWYAHLQLGSREEAEDLVEDLFARLAESW